MSSPGGRMGAWGGWGAWDAWTHAVDGAHEVHEAWGGLFGFCWLLPFMLILPSPHAPMPSYAPMCPCRNPVIAASSSKGSLAAPMRFSAPHADQVAAFQATVQQVCLNFGGRFPTHFRGLAEFEHAVKEAIFHSLSLSITL